MPSILLVAQLSPPSTLVAARRVAGLTRYLGRLGHQVTVLTSEVSGEGEIDGATSVVRTRDLIATRLNWRREHFAALGGRADGSYSRPSRLESLLVPDVAAVSWLPFALRAARRLARRKRPDVVVTSSPPASAHAVGAALARRGVPWIAEFRDGWRFEPPRAEWPTAMQRRLDDRFERAVARRADALVAVTQPIADDLKARFDRDVHVITNGFDPDTVGSGSEARPDPLLDPRRFSLVHTGRMGIGGSTPRPLLDALRLLRREAPETASGLEVVFVGPVTAEEDALLRADDLADIVRPAGAVDHARALELQRAADALLVVTQGAIRRSVATGKLFEYLAAGPPILVLGEETEAARIVAETGSGIATSATDERQIAAALKKLAASPPPPRADLSPVAAYSYEEIALRYERLVDSVISRAEN